MLQVAADAHQQPTWSLYRALNEADQRITSPGSNRDPGAYIQELRRDIHNAKQQSPEGVVVQGRETKTGAWTNLTRAPHAEEALDFIQESDVPPPATLEETAEALVRILHSWTRGHTIVLHDKTGPPYARTATCRPSIAATGEAHLKWKPEREDDEYTLVHATRHGHREEKEPTPEPAATPPTRPTPRHWTLYRQLAHARTLAEHSIRPYTAVAYVERMLQDWTKYETEVLEGHTGPPGATSRTTWDDIVPDGAIGALATTVRATFGDGSRPDHPFGDNRNPAITNAILAYHSWSTQQSIHLHTPHDDPREWHPIGPPALKFYLHEDAATGAHNITSPRPIMPQPIPEPHIPPSPTKPQTNTRHEHRPPQQGHSPAAHEKAEPPNATTTVQQLDKPLTLRHFRQLPATPRGEPHKEHGNDMATTDRHHRLEESPPTDSNNGIHAPPYATPSTPNTGHAPLSHHRGHGDHGRHGPGRRRPDAPGETHTSDLDKRDNGYRHYRRPQPGVDGYPLHPGLHQGRPHADGMADKVGRRSQPPPRGRP